MARKIFRKIIGSYNLPAGHPERSTLTDVLATFKALLALQDQEARLVGLDRVSVPVDELSSMSDAELEKLMAEWSADG